MNGSKFGPHRFNLIAWRQTGIGIFWANTIRSQLASDWTENALVAAYFAISQKINFADRISWI